MPIEFRCSQCNQLLRVPDDSAGKAARCPKCQALMSVPAGESALPPAVFVQPMGAPPPPPPSSGNPFGDSGGRNPFGEPASSPNLNPYASPAIAMGLPSPYFARLAPIERVPVNPQRVSFETVFNQAWQVWQSNLGLLVGITVTIFVINFAVTIPAGIVQAILEENGQRDALAVVRVVTQIIAGSLQVYLGIGQSQVLIKLFRRQPANFTELFGAGYLFWPVLGAFLLFGLLFALSFLFLIIPCVIFYLRLWPFRFLIIDQNAGPIESFSQAAEITSGNWGTALLLMLVSIGLFFMGCVSCYIGLLFAMPLISALWVAAYLLMAGQLSTYAPYAPVQKW